MQVSIKELKTLKTFFSEDTRYAYYNARLEFTFQTQLILAAVDYNDSDAIITEKINLVARFIDLYINSRVTNYSSCSYNYIKNAIFNITKVIRNNDVLSLKANLNSEYAKLGYDPDVAMKQFRLNVFTKRYIKNMIARFTSYFERETSITDNYAQYMDWNTKNPFEIEHILCNHFSLYSTAFTDESEFYRYRNSIGALVLLRKSINASLSDKLYTDKVSVYGGTQGNIYAGLLGDTVYMNNPKLNKLITDNNLNCKQYTSFGKTEIDERVEFVTQLVKLIWNTEMFN